MAIFLRSARRPFLCSHARFFFHIAAATSPPQRNPNLPIQLLDVDLWGFSSRQPRPPPPREEEEEDPFDEIDDLRIRKSLFYKMEKHSREYEERSVRFHKTKSAKHQLRHNPKGFIEGDDEIGANSMNAEKKKEKKKKKNPSKDLPKINATKNETAVRWTYRENAARGSLLTEGDDEIGDGVEFKRVRTPTFNELTDPYHLPFCLDIYITKGSVRACVVHRATSKVVAVAHSISKDMRFDLNSRKDVAACAAVGGALAQRAIADDIYNVVYTPRKGERIEGKLQVVLQSIIDGGIDVRVKIRQKRPSMATMKARK